MLANVAEIFFAIWPDLPIPEITNRPEQLYTELINFSKQLGKFSDKVFNAFDSTSITSLAISIIFF